MLSRKTYNTFDILLLKLDFEEIYLKTLFLGEIPIAWQLLGHQTLSCIQ